MSQLQTHAPPIPPPAGFDPKQVIESALSDHDVQRDLLNWAKSKTGHRNAIQAEDIVQEGCKRAWKKVSEYDPTRATPTAWIIGYMKYVWLEERRKAAKGPTTTSEWNDVKDVRIHHEKDFEYAEMRFRIQRHYLKLPVEYRSVVKMKYFEDLDGHEAAKRLELSYDSYRARLSRALKMLREFARGDDKEGRS